MRLSHLGDLPNGRISAQYQIAGTRLVENWLAVHGINRWYALSYGLWAGLVAAVRLDLAEPLCFALVAAAFLAQLRRCLPIFIDG